MNNSSQRQQVVEAPQKGNLPGARDAWNRDRTTLQVNGLGSQVLLPTELIENQKASPQVVLLSGQRDKLTLTQDGMRIVGQPGTGITTLSLKASDLLIEGCTIESVIMLDNLTGVRFSRCTFNQVLTISAGSSLQFEECCFRKEVSVPATGSIQVQGGKAFALYQVANGGKGHWTSTMFLAASAVNNVGVAANCYISQAIRKSGVAHNNCTVLSETV